MGDQSSIEWTDATLYRSKVVSRNESPRSPGIVISGKGLIASALAFDHRVGLARFTPRMSVFERAMLNGVAKTIRCHLKIVTSVILFVAIEVMDLFPFSQHSTECCHSDDPVFIGVSTAVSERVIGNAYQHVAVRREDAPAFPFRVPFLVLPFWPCHEVTIHP